MRDQVRQTVEQWDAAKVVGSLLPSELRHPRPGSTYTVGEQFLVFTGRGKRADGAPFNHVEIRGAGGEVLDKVELDFEGFLNTLAADCVIAYQDEIARIYSPDATLEAVFSLKDLPEISAVRVARNRNYHEQDLPFTCSRADASPRTVSANLTHRLLAVAVIDHVFLYGFDGDVRAALCLPRQDQREDWVNFLRFSIDGRSLYLGTYSGVVVKMSFQGVVQQTWNLGGESPYLVVEDDGMLSGITRGDHAFRLTPDGRAHIEPSAVYPAGDLIGPYLVAAEKKEIFVFDLHSFIGFRVALPQTRTATYIEDGKLAIETATRKWTVKA